MRGTVRERRLAADYQRLLALVSNHDSRLDIEAARGTPPETYILVFKVRSIVGVSEDKPLFSDRHRLKLELPAEYPALPPLASVLGAIFHPHVWNKNNVVCLGPWHLTESLDNLAMRLRGMLAYDLHELNWKSVANSEAAIWASRNQHLFPLGNLKRSNL